MQLRPYQVKFKQAIYNSFRINENVLAQLPTGAGKTAVLSSIVFEANTHARPRRVCVIAHRHELIEQAASKLAHMGLNPQVITGGKKSGLDYDPYGLCLVSSIQVAERKLFDVPIDLLIIDEAHHSTAPTYRRLINKVSEEGGRTLGLTATPIRTNGQGFEDIYEDLVCGPSASELIQLGYLVPTAESTYGVKLSEDIMREVKVVAGDYNKEQLAEAMARGVLVGDIIGSYQRIAGGKKCIVFAASVALSKMYAEAYNSAGIPAAHIDGTTEKEERKQILDKFRRGEITILCNCEIVTEGFDVPDTEAVQLIRPTKSLSLYLQMVGRAMRPALGKECAIIIDHSDNVLRFGFAEMERKWVLRGKMKIEVPKDLQVEEIIDPEFLDEEKEGPTRTRDVEHFEMYKLNRLSVNDLYAPGELSIDQTAKFRVLVRLMETVRTRGITDKKGKLNLLWAWNQYKSTLNGQRPPLEAAVWFAKEAGYPASWAKKAVFKSESQPQLRQQHSRASQSSLAVGTNSRTQEHYQFPTVPEGLENALGYPSKKA